MAADGGSSSLQLPCVFSPKSRQFLALCAQDGRLRIWNTDSKTLHQEYVPSAHLSATCTCIAWGPCRTVKEGPQRKKRKSEAVQVEEKADLLAMGTAAGTVLIYSTAKGALHCTLDGGHSGGVNCVEWHSEESLLYSGSDDTNIVEWDLQTGKTRSKWKADRAAVTSLCVSPDGKLLLSAGHVIKMWDLDTKEVYRKFTGHSTAVTTLRFATTRPPDSNGLYFLSGAAHDRLLSVWQVRGDGKDKNSVVSFTLTDEPRHIDLVTSNSKEEAVRLAVVCKDGQLHLFEHFLNGPCKKPLSPSCTVQMSDTKVSPMPIPLLAAALGADTRTVMLAYGNHLQPVMEKVEINTAERHVCLTRDVQTTLSLSMETTVSKVKTPIVNAKSKVLVPGLPGHQAPLKGTSQGSEKRKKDTDTKEMSIAERLGEIDLSTVSEKGASKGTASLQTDNFAVLLVQGLESNDANILNKVFQTRKEMVIKKTVARLPLPAVLPLVEELTKRLQGHPFMAVLMVRWLKAVLMHHTSYLASLPDLVTQLGVLYHMIESRVKMFHKLTKLHGKLYLLMTQMATTDSSNMVSDVDHTAKLVYEDESSDEDEASGDEGLPDEDSDHWEEDEAMEDDDQEEQEDEDPDNRTESKANGEEDMEHENESEEE
ncbi:WD repeat-containing protein 43 isoform X1 [Archocentrus centrarchus]|uniref:WD repeat-containing protein 43 isoform X1 n=1 Tax=Archocentrus centrarchus TaxID=63155 RepID=UPI0011EA1B51|nr:WD repeat-containing protein 43 isoform X1 [Archocentrus centrarchus]XP_030574417.1 WD repeat-containing protein 43 isoform X1 [Archocentrus centrarchus]